MPKAQGGLPPTPQRTLPDPPNLEHLKNEARQRLKLLRTHTPSAKLADAQFHLARDHGFASWPALKAEVERRIAQGLGPAGDLGRYVGWFAHDPAVATHSVAEITREGERLFMQATGGPRLALVHLGGGRFGVEGLDRHWSFETEGDGPARALCRAGPAALRLERIDAAAAAEAQAGFTRALADQNRPRREVEIDPASLDALVGRYASPLGLEIDIARTGDRLFAQPTGQSHYELYPESETRFFFRVVPAQVVFHLGAGRAEGLTLAQNGQEMGFSRAAAAQAGRIAKRLAEQQRPRAVAVIDPALRGGYAGVYQLDARRTATVEAEDGHLFVQITDQPRFEVYPESETSFFYTVAAAQIRFVPDPAGQAQHAVIHQYGRQFPLARVDAAP